MQLIYIRLHKVVHHTFIYVSMIISMYSIHRKYFCKRSGTNDCPRNGMEYVHTFYLFFELIQQRGYSMETSLKSSLMIGHQEQVGK